MRKKYLRYLGFSRGMYEFDAKIELAEQKRDLCVQEIMKILGTKSKAVFNEYMRGEKTPNSKQYSEIRKAFWKYGVHYPYDPEPIDEGEMQSE